jgi:hypothetical protein
MGAPGRHSVNRTNGKPCFMSVDTSVDLSNATGVTVTDENGDGWVASPFKIIGTPPRTMVIKLKGKKPKITKEDGGDTGQLTVVLSTPADTTQVPVNYVDDSSP